MGERYLITGVELGMFQVFAKENKPDKINKLVEEIIDKQFVGNTSNPIKQDVNLVSKMFSEDYVTVGECNRRIYDACKKTLKKATKKPKR